MVLIRTEQRNKYTLFFKFMYVSKKKTQYGPHSTVVPSLPNQKPNTNSLLHI